MAYTTITGSELQRSATEFQEELLMMPVIGAQDTLKHMSGRAGTRGRVIEGEVSGDIELAPYSNSTNNTSGVTIKQRILETHLGSVIKKFDPNEVRDTVYGSLIAQGDALAEQDINRQILMFLAGQLGKKLNMAIFSGTYSATGTTTAALFDGFDTITGKEITATTIKAANGNYYEPDVITDANAVDELKALYFAASDELQSIPTKMFMSRSVYNSYCENYKAVTGAVAYNQQYEKTFLEGSDGLCELVPLASKKNSAYIQIAPQANMRYGFGNGVEGELVTVEKHHPFVLDFVATMYFGVQFRSISKEWLMVGKPTAKSNDGN